MSDPAVKPIPDGYACVTPYLCVHDAAAALDFYARAFGAVERLRIDGPEGTIGHAEFTIGQAVFMLSDECPAMGARSARSIGGSPVFLFVFVPDVDAFFANAVAAGATERQPVQTHFYGDRAGLLEDPFGHLWSFATHVEDVPPDEIARRAAEFAKSCEG